MMPNHASIFVEDFPTQNKVKLLMGKLRNLNLHFLAIDSIILHFMFAHRKLTPAKPPTSKIMVHGQPSHNEPEKP